MIRIDSAFCDDFTPEWKVRPSITHNHIIILVSEGQLTYTIGGSDIPLEKGDLLYIPAGTHRSGTDHSNQRHQKYSAHFRVIAKGIASPLLTEQMYKKTHTHNFNYLKQRFLLLFQHWIGKLPSYNLICHGILLELIGMTEREINAQQYSSRKVELIAQVKKYILHHYREPIKIAELAAHVQRTPNYITNIFKEVTGQSPIQYVHHVRVSSARDLILNSTMNLAEIADYLGFCDQAYFNKVFKSILGISPSSLRKSWQ